MEMAFALQVQGQTGNLKKHWLCLLEMIEHAKLQTDCMSEIVFYDLRRGTFLLRVMT